MELGLGVPLAPWLTQDLEGASSYPFSTGIAWFRNKQCGHIIGEKLDWVRYQFQMYLMGHNLSHYELSNKTSLYQISS